MSSEETRPLGSNRTEYRRTEPCTQSAVQLKRGRNTYSGRSAGGQSCARHLVRATSARTRYGRSRYVSPDPRNRYKTIKRLINDAVLISIRSLIYPVRPHEPELPVPVAVFSRYARPRWPANLLTDEARPSRPIIEIYRPRSRVSAYVGSCAFRDHSTAAYAVSFFFFL